MFEGKRIHASRHDALILIARFGNPPQGTMDALTEAELIGLLDLVDADPHVRVIILTGADQEVFIRHYDVGVLEERARAMASRKLSFRPERPVPESPVHVCLRRIESSGKIFIAALNGTAMGGGFELALACDLRIAQAGDYRIGLPETNIGLLPGAGGTQRLARLIGPGRALEHILLGRTFRPAEAVAAGLVNECCREPVLERALELASALAAKQPRALAHVKRLVAMNATHASDEALACERTLFCDLMVDAATIELMAQMNAGLRRIEG